MGDHARLAGCNIPVHLADDTLGQIVSCNFILQCQLLQLGHETPVTADDLGHQTFVTEMVQTLILAVTHACAVQQCQVAGMTARKEFLLNGQGNFLRVSRTNETTKGNGRAVLDVSLYCFGNGHDLCHIVPPCRMITMFFSSFLYFYTFSISQQKRQFNSIPPVQLFLLSTDNLSFSNK